MTEAVDKKDTVTMDIPLLIRVLELAREDLKSDADLHRVVEKLIDIRDQGVLTMDNYNYVANIKEGLEITDDMNEMLDEDLRKWFQQKWVRMDTKGNIKGDCAREPGEGKPKCLPQARAHALGKEGRASAARRKRREDPNPERKGKPINVATESVTEACWDTHKQEGMKKKGNKMVPNCVPKTEEVEHLEEKNKPTSPDKWARAKAAAKSKFAVYPSAYANAWAAKKYKAMGGGWRSTNEETLEEDKFQDSYAATQTVGMELENGSSERKKQMSKSARMIKALYKKHRVSEDMFDHEKENKSVASYGRKKSEEVPGSDKPKAAIVMQGGKTMTGQTRDTVEIDPQMNVKPGLIGNTKVGNR